MIQSAMDGLVLGIGLGLIILGLIGLYLGARMVWNDMRGK
jgi:hypothetical protein